MERSTRRQDRYLCVCVCVYLQDYVGEVWQVQ